MPHTHEPLIELTNDTPRLRFVVAAKRSGGLHHIADFSTEGRAVLSIKDNLDRDPLVIVCGDVCRAPNGNVRLWQSKEVCVLVTVADPTSDFIDWANIDAMPGSVNLRTGEIYLDNPKQGHPLWSSGDTRISILCNGGQYCARRLSDNVPVDMRDSEVAEFIHQHGYIPSIDLATLAFNGCAGLH